MGRGCLRIRRIGFISTFESRAQGGSLERDGRFRPIPGTDAIEEEFRRQGPETTGELTDVETDPQVGAVRGLFGVGHALGFARARGSCEWPRADPSASHTPS